MINGGVTLLFNEVGDLILLSYNPFGFHTEI